MRIRPKRFDIETYGEAFLRARQINERRAQDAIKSRKRVVKGSSPARQPSKNLLLLRERNKKRTIDHSKIDTTASAAAAAIRTMMEVSMR